MAKMTLVQELRHYGYGDGIVFDKPVLARKLRKAADEIERLRVEVELWQGRWEAERADHESTIEGYKNAGADVTKSHDVI